MDNNTLIALVIVLFVLVLIAAFALYRSRVKARITGPFGTGVDLDASNDPPPSSEPGRPGIEASRLKAGRGNVEVVTQRGKDMKVDDVEAGQDISIRDEQVSPDPDPKDGPPA